MKNVVRQFLQENQHSKSMKKDVKVILNFNSISYGELAIRLLGILGDSASQAYSLPIPLLGQKIPSLEFLEYEKKIKMPYKIYADFESYFDISSTSKCFNNSMDTTSIKYLKEHKMMAWVILINSFN